MYEFNVFVKHSKNFSLQGFKEYCLLMRLDIALHPSFELEKWDGGFLPARFIDSRFKCCQKDFDFLTGFELYFEKCDYSVGQLPDGWDYPHMVALRCSMADSFEVLMAYVLGAYLVKTCEGVFLDPQSGAFSEDYRELEAAICEIMTELIDFSKNGELRTHCFKGWED